MRNLQFYYSLEKNAQLKIMRGISFEEIEFAISDGKILDVLDHHNKEKYPNQKIYVININDYVYLVPFVKQKNSVFLKTIFPSRKLTKKYLQINIETFKVDHEI